MDLDLSGKLALVTGSTRGIGLAAAKGLAEMGAEVIVNGRDRSTVFDAIAQIARLAPKAKLHPAPFDLGGAAGCADIVEQFSEVDILVNNLGIYEPKGFFGNKAAKEGMRKRDTFCVAHIDVGGRKRPKSVGMSFSYRTNVWYISGVLKFEVTLATYIF